MDKSSYVICYVNNNILDLVRQVEEYLKLGYVCQGGISVSTIGTNIALAQAMILNK